MTSSTNQVDALTKKLSTTSLTPTTAPAAVSCTSTVKKTGDVATGAMQATNSSGAITANVSVVQQAPTLGSLIVGARRDLEAALKLAGEKDGDALKAIRQHYGAVQSGLLQMIESRPLPTKHEKSQAANWITLARTKFEPIVPAVKEAHSQLANKTEAQRAPIKKELEAKAAEWKNVYDAACPVGKLLYQVEDEWKAAVKTNQEQKAPPLSQEELDSIIDPDVSLRAKTHVAAHQAITDSNNVWADSLKEDCEAVGLYFYLVAAILSYLLAGAVVALPAAAAWGISSAFNWLFRRHPQDPQVYSAVAPDPFEGKKPPTFTL